jgi:ribosomal protein L37AE/L43A
MPRTAPVGFIVIVTRIALHSPCHLQGSNLCKACAGMLDRSCSDVQLISVRAALAHWLIDVKSSRPVLTALKFNPVPDPECPKCHHEDIERLDPVIPRWLACRACGHMWSSRTKYSQAERAMVLAQKCPNERQ